MNAGNNENISAKLATDPWRLPLLFTVGLSIDLLDMDWLQWQLSADALHPNNNDSYLRAGTEMALYQMFYLRCGHSAIFRKKAEDGFALGGGIRYNFGSMRLGFDYSSTDSGRLGRIPQWGISLGI